jgi:tRNA1Val (adenine37-N6)-methyltransferase
VVVAAPTKGAAATVPKPCRICDGRGTLVRTRRRRREVAKPMTIHEGWVQYGPVPLGDCGKPVLQRLPDEDLCCLTGHWQLFQKLASHRYSTDDVVAAWVAWRVGAWVAAAKAAAPAESTPAPGGAAATVDGAGAAAVPAVQRTVDIGCGIGSVLLMTAWLHPTAVCVGVEAQPARAAMAARSVEYNGVAHRVTVRNGDLRDPAMTPEGPVFDLVTGTPPYFNLAIGGTPPCEESARCLFEFRGGVEAYCAAAARLLAPRHGLFIVCESSQGVERGYAGAAAAGLRVLARVDVVPKAGKPALFGVYVMCAVSAPYIVSSPAAGADGDEATCGGMRGGGSVAVNAGVFAQAPPHPHPYNYVHKPRPAAAPAQAYAEPADHHVAAADADAKSGEDFEDGRAVGGEQISAAVAPAAVAPGPGQRAYPPKPKHRQQPPRHETWTGKPVMGELVVVITVRDAAANRTEQYRALLGDMGKPG